MGLLREKYQVRSHPSNPDNWLLYGLGANSQSHAGVSVTEDNSLGFTPVWSAVTQLSQTIASLPLHLYKRLERGKKKATENPLYTLLHIQPNPEMSSMAFREFLMAQVLLWGDAYAEINRDNSGAVKGLWPLLSRNMTITRPLSEISYMYRLPSGEFRPFKKDAILHISGFSVNGITGVNMIRQNSEAIGLGMALEEFGARFFGSGARPGVVLEHPDNLSKDAAERLRKAWEEMHSGLSNSHRLAILEEGMKLNNYGVSPSEAQALESRKFQVVEVARIFNMPVHLLKDLERATNNNIEHQGLEYVIYTLRPWLVRLEQAYTLQILNEKERKKLFFEHLVDGLLRGDIDSRYRAYATGIQNGFLLRNDVRDFENLNPLPEGDEALIPLNMIPASMVGMTLEKPAPEPEPKEPEEASVKQAKEFRAAKPIARDRISKNYYPLWKDVAQRIVNREAVAIKKAVQKHLGERSKRSVTEFKEWLEGFYKEMPNYVQQQVGPVVRSFMDAIGGAAAAEVGQDLEISAELTQFMQDYVDGYSQRHIDRSLGQLTALLEEETEKIETRINEWSDTRADKIAHEETVRAGSAMAQAVFFALGFKTVWRTRGSKSCPFCQQLNGKVIGRGQIAIDAGDQVKVEGQEPLKVYHRKAHPPLHGGCTCYIAPSL